MSPGEGTGETDLPAGFTWKSRYLHTMRGTSRTRGCSLVVGKGAFAVTSAPSELDSQTFAHEV
jgi:hypothetical protein